MSEFSVFSLDKITALTEQIRKDFDCVMVNTYTFSNNFTINLELKNFPNEPKKLVELQDKVAAYFGFQDKEPEKVSLLVNQLEIIFDNIKFKLNKTY